MTQTAIVPGQIWTPDPSRRAFAREVVRMKTDPDGYPTVVYSHFWPNCGHTETSSIRVDGFRAWISKMRATMKESADTREYTREEMRAACRNNYNAALEAACAALSAVAIESGCECCGNPILLVTALDAAQAIRALKERADAE